MQKRNMYRLLLALTAGLLILVLGIAVVQQSAIDPITYLQFREDVQGMALQPWHEEATDTWHLFLPAYAGQEDLSITAAPGVTYALEDLPGTLRVKTPFRSREYSLEIQQCTNLPTLSLDAEEGTLDYIHSRIEHEKDVFVTMTDEAGKTILQQVGTLSGRGNGTWGGSKRPYNLNFSNKLSVGPFEDISKFCLLAEAYDESKLRNSIAYYGARELGIPYTSGYMHCNVYINGEYRGIYGITTKQEYEKHIEKDDIQGVFEYTFYTKENQFFTFPALKTFRVIYGNMDRIRDAVDYAYAAVIDRNWEECAKVLDLPSFAKKYAMDEFFGNEDLCLASQYYYLDGDNVIHAVLPWDYDWSMGSTNRYFDLPPERDVLAKKFPEFWVSILLENPAFREEILRALDTSFTQAWIDGIDDHTRTQISLISDSLECDALRWHSTQKYNRYDKMPDRAHLLDLQKTYRRYYPARRDFLREYFTDPDAYVAVTMQVEQFPVFYLPRGAELSEYLKLSNVWNCRNLNPNIQQWLTEDGLTPEEIGAVEEDLVFLPVLGPEEPAEGEPVQDTVPVLDRPWLKWTILGCLVVTLALLAGTDILRQRMGRKKKDEVAV